MIRLLFFVAFQLVINSIYAQEFEKLDELLENRDFQSTIDLSNQYLEKASTVEDSLKCLNKQVHAYLSLTFNKKAEELMSHIDTVLLNRHEELSKDLSNELERTKERQLYHNDEYQDGYEKFLGLREKGFFEKKELLFVIDSLRYQKRLNSDFQIVDHLTQINRNNKYNSFEDSVTIASAIIENLLYSSSDYNKDSIVNNYLVLLDKKYPTNNMSKLIELHTVATVYSTELEDIKKSDSIMEIVLKSLKSEFSKTNLNHVQIYYQYANVCMQNGRYKEALNYYEDNVKVLEEMNIRTEDVMIYHYVGIASIYQTLGEYNKAKVNYKKGIELLESKETRDENLYLVILSNHAVLLKNTGDLIGSIKQNLKVLDGLKRTIGENHINYLITETNLTRVYIELKDIEKARNTIDGILKRYETNNYTKYKSYAFALFSKCACEINTKGSNEAVKYCQAAYDKLKEIAPDDYVNLINFSLDVSRAHEHSGDIEKAISISLDTKEQLSKEDNRYPGISPILNNNLASYYHQTQEYDKAFKHLNAARSYQDSVFTKYYYKRNTTNKTYIFNSYYKNDSVNFIKYLNEYVDVLEFQIENDLQYLNERKILKFVQNLQLIVNNIFALSFKMNIDHHNLKLPLFKLSSLSRNLSFRLNKLKSFKAYSEKNTNWSNKYYEWEKTTKRLKSNIYSKNPKLETDSLISAIERMEFDFSSELNLDFADLSFSNKSIQNLLSEDEILFDIYKFTPKDTVHRYAVFIISPGEFQLFDNLSKHDFENDLNKLIKKSINNLTKKIIFNTTGDLVDYPFNALKTMDGKYYSDNYEVLHINSYLDLKESNNVLNEKSALLLGGISYNKQIDFEESTNNNQLVLNRSIGFKNKLPNSVQNLPGSKTEVLMIERLSQKANIQTTLLTGSYATKINYFSAIDSQNFNIIHFATHGFFNPISLDSFYFIPYNSGLFMAGYNTDENKTNSLILAKDIENLDLSQTQLVVLSACHSGLGVIQKSEGLFGLQRAFKKAGVQNLVVTLGEIPDQASSEFFQIFYQNLYDGLSIAQSFNNSLDRFKNSYSEDIWSKFKLLGKGQATLTNNSNNISFNLVFLIIVVVIIIAFLLLKRKQKTLSNNN